MSVDQELQRALEEAEAEAGGVPAVAQPPREQAPKPKRKGNLGLLVGLLVIVGAVLVVVFSATGGEVIYSVGVDTLVKDPGRYKDRSVRAKGMLVKGTLARRDEPCEYRFKLIEHGAELEVHHPSCIVPDTFKDMPGMDVEVQAEGQLSADGKTFVSNNIIAKCPSKYEMQQKSMAGEIAPHVGTQASPLDTFAQKN
jgi:cytochrome c-type biogenesis protein CcmE